MFNLNGWSIEGTKFHKSNVAVFNEDLYWFIKVDGEITEDDFFSAEDALKEAEIVINCLEK